MAVFLRLSVVKTFSFLLAAAHCVCRDPYTIGRLSDFNHIKTSPLDIKKQKRLPRGSLIDGEEREEVCRSQVCNIIIRAEWRVISRKSLLNDPQKYTSMFLIHTALLRSTRPSLLYWRRLNFILLL